MTRNERTNENTAFPEEPDFDLWSLVPDPEETALVPSMELEEERVQEEVERAGTSASNSSSGASLALQHHTHTSSL